MTNASTQAELRTMAIRNLERKRVLRGHLRAYLIVLGALWVVWAVMAVQLGVRFAWPILPTLGWGIGLALHGWSVYGPPAQPITEENISREERRLSSRQ